jgi:hypothetical protein
MFNETVPRECPRGHGQRSSRHAGGAGRAQALCADEDGGGHAQARDPWRRHPHPVVVATAVAAAAAAAAVRWHARPRRRRRRPPRRRRPAGGGASRSRPSGAAVTTSAHATFSCQCLPPLPLRRRSLGVPCVCVRMLMFFFSPYSSVSFLALHTWDGVNCCVLAGRAPSCRTGVCVGQARTAAPLDGRVHRGIRTSRGARRAGTSGQRRCLAHRPCLDGRVQSRRCGRAAAAHVAAVRGRAWRHGAVRPVQPPEQAC